MNATLQEGPRRLLGVSVPRSGHTYLAALLREALQDDLFYCEAYTPEDCCRLLPCTRGMGTLVAFQKNHDLQLRLDTNIEGVTYLIQYRDPVMAILSEREYMAEVEGASVAQDRDQYAVWLGRKAAYFHHFWEKWLRTGAESRIVVEYSELLREPVAVLKRILESIGVESDRMRLDAAAAGVSGTLIAAPGAKPGRAFVKREAEASEYFDPGLLAGFESAVLGSIPELERFRHFDPAGPSHPTILMYQAEMLMLAHEHVEAADRLRAAVRVEPENPFLWNEFARVLKYCGHLRSSLEAVEEACRLRPDEALFASHRSDLLSEMAQSMAPPSVATTPNTALTPEERVAARLRELGPTPLAPVAPDFWVDALGVLTSTRYRSDYQPWGGTAHLDISERPLEWLAVLDAVAEGAGSFCAVELGAGHGPWLARAGVAWRRRYPGAPMRLIGVEGEPTHFVWLKEHLSLNKLASENNRLVEGAVAAGESLLIDFETSADPASEWGTRPAGPASPPALPRVPVGRHRPIRAFSLSELLAEEDRADLLHIDIQGDEYEVLKASAEAVRAKVQRLCVGTHGRGIEEQLMTLLPGLGFQLEAEEPCRFRLPGPSPVLVRDGTQYWVRRGM